jgi:hypothetical protein
MCVIYDRSRPSTSPMALSDAGGQREPKWFVMHANQW